jgi:hypothetical protein
MNLAELKEALLYDGATSQKLALILLPRFLTGDEKLDEFKEEMSYIPNQREALVWLLPELLSWNFSYSRDLRDTVVGDFVLALVDLVRKYHCTPELQDLVIGMSVYLHGSLPGGRELALELFEAITENMQMKALRGLTLKMFRGESFGVNVAAVLDAQAEARQAAQRAEELF